MATLFKTESGTTYEINDAGDKVRRVPLADGNLRGDEEWLSLLGISDLVVGRSVRMVLEPLSAEAAVTVRTTSPVTTILKGN